MSMTGLPKLHSIAGVVTFATGLGICFYSGNVQRPF